MKQFLKLLRDRSGAAAIEFGLLTTFLFTVFLPVLDFGYFLLGQHRLDQAVSAAVLKTFVNRSTVDFSGMPTYVSNSANAPATVTTTVTCNGGNTTCGNSSRACYCLSTAGAYTAAASCTASCTGGSYSTGQIAGYYVTINASYTHASLALPKRWLNGGSVQRTVTVRIQ